MYEREERDQIGGLGDTTNRGRLTKANPIDLVLVGFQQQPNLASG